MPMLRPMTIVAGGAVVVSVTSTFPLVVIEKL
jgi:hypothetical protein